MKSEILVIGGTGKTGSRVVKHLEGKGINPQIGARNASPAFDWNNKETWVEALNGIKRIYISYYPDLAVPGAKEAIKSLAHLAEELGVEKVVLLSGKGETEAEACEQIIQNTNMNYTIVRASWFNQNWSESFLLSPILFGEVALPMSDVLIPFVDADDIAEVAAMVLLNDAYNGEIIEVTGPELITFKNAVECIADATDRSISFNSITLDEYVDLLKKQQVPADVVWLMEYLFSHVLTNPKNQELTTGVEYVLNRKPKTFRSYAQKTALTGIWKQQV